MTARCPNILWYCTDQQRWDTIRVLGDHGLVLKGCRFFDGLVRVPLIGNEKLKLQQMRAHLDALMATVDVGPPRFVNY